MAVDADTLRSRARQRADMENSLFIGDAEALALVDDATRELYDMLLASDEHYFDEPTDITIDSGDQTIDLANIQRVFDLERVENDGFVNVPRIPFEERRLAATRCYCIVGGNIYVWPLAQAEGDYRLWCTPAWPGFYDEDDTIPTAMEPWAEFIVVAAAIKMLVKEESNTSALEAARTAIVARIQSLAASRDDGEPGRIVDIEERDGPPRLLSL